MARIEISLEEYNSLKTKINELEKELVEKDKKIEETNSIIEDYKDEMLYIVNDVTLFDRIFNWNSLSKSINLLLNETS